jgi:hypothetical protein
MTIKENPGIYQYEIRHKLHISRPKLRDSLISLSLSCPIYEEEDGGLVWLDRWAL